MRNLSTLIPVLFLLFIVPFGSLHAQSVSTKIMDARIDWTPTGGQYAGTVSVYLTDSTGVSGIKISIGSQPDDSDLYLSNQSIDINGNLSGQGSMHNNVLQTSIGNFSAHADYYAKISVLLIGGQKNQIAVHSSN